LATAVASAALHRDEFANAEFILLVTAAIQPLRDAMLDQIQTLLITWRYESNCKPFASSTASPSDPVNIAIHIKWHIIVKDVSNTFNIQTPSCYVCRY
jgi:hypothetical protein